MHFLRKDRVIHLRLTPFEWGEVREVIDRGIPKALYSLADAVRSAIIILMITSAGGVMGASVLTVQSTIGYGLTVFSTGLAGVVAILAGICCGEKNGHDLEGIGIEDDASQDSDNIEHALITVIATDKDGAAKSFDMDWQIIFDKDDKDLIQKVELTDDGGFFEAYQDGE
ncbi:MAG: hypothetical protein IJG59_07880 [Erysipelotrichaceae bacterium]|nr:hypothetical protein [Erysipelotrichaceae bacterium]